MLIINVGPISLYLYVQIDGYVICSILSTATYEFNWDFFEKQKSYKRNNRLYGHSLDEGENYVTIIKTHVVIFSSKFCPFVILSFHSSKVTANRM